VSRKVNGTRECESLKRVVGRMGKENWREKEGENDIESGKWFV
jgi:hypothetical protein